MPEKSRDPATLILLKKAEREGVEVAWDRYLLQQPQCGFGLLGVCCRNCNMGPCRADPFGEGPQKGVCGADAHTMVARNLLRAIAAGAAAHSDHGRDVVETLWHAATGKIPDYRIRDEGKVRRLAAECGLAGNGKEPAELARDDLPGGQLAACRAGCSLRIHRGRVFCPECVALVAHPVPMRACRLLEAAKSGADETFPGPLRH